MKQMITLSRGFRFGMLLQIAIGPVCLYVLKTALESGFAGAVAAAAAATLADAIFVAFAVAGIGVLLDKPGVKSFLRCFGAIVLAYYGAGILLGGFGLDIMPGLGGLRASAKTSGAFISCFFLTISSPLTILFWTGVFASKLTNENYSRADMPIFGTGAVLSTLASLGLVAFLSGLLQPVITPKVISILNMAIGAALLIYAIRMISSKAPGKAVSTH